MCVGQGRQPIGCRCMWVDLLVHVCIYMGVYIVCMCEWMYVCACAYGGRSVCGCKRPPLGQGRESGGYSVCVGVCEWV